MRKTLNDHGLIIILTLISLLMLVLTNQILDNNNVWYSILTSIGSAMIAGVILSITVEKISSEHRESQTKQAVSEIKENLFKAIYGRAIPSVIFNEVEESLLKSDVIRRRYTVDYIIKELEDSNDHFLCMVSSSYELENISNRAIHQKVHFGLEASVDKKYSRYTNITSFQCDGQKYECENRDDEHQVYIEVKVNLKAGDRIRVNMQGQLVKRDTDSELWASLIPSDGMTLRVTSAIDNLDIDAKINNSQPLEVISNDPDSGTYHWDHANGIFPYQSVIFWWSRKTS